jgi:hypothetical protein
VFVNAEPAARYAAYFHELDAWTEYWDVYHPETRGRFYFGDGVGEVGLLTSLLPRVGRPPVFTAWTRRALHGDDVEPRFATLACAPEVSSAVREVDALLGRIFERHFGAAAERSVQVDYLTAMHGFACDTLPAASERDARIGTDDPRKRTAGRHTLDGDIMWFAWALQLEAAQLNDVSGEQRARHALQMAGVAAGCAANFVKRGDRRTRALYLEAGDLSTLLLQRGLTWVEDFSRGVREVQALFRIREWGDEDAD